MRHAILDVGIIMCYIHLLALVITFVMQCEEYISGVKVSTHERKTAQWQHMQWQFHLPFPAFVSCL
jgi:hypothetical protein